MNKTFVNTTHPWGLFSRRGHRLLCSDGVIRAAELAPTADTFFSVPARVRVKGKWISGYYTGEDDYDFEAKVEYRACAFRHHSCHADKLPEWPAKFSPEHLALIKANADEIGNPNV